MLIPLLGIHEVVFTVLIDECVEGSSRYARDFINLTLSSFQVPMIHLTVGRCRKSTSKLICDVLLMFSRDSSWQFCTVLLMERYVLTFQ